MVGVSSGISGRWVRSDGGTGDAGTGDAGKTAPGATTSSVSPAPTSATSVGASVGIVVGVAVGTTGVGDAAIGDEAESVAGISGVAAVVTWLTS